MNVPRPSRSSGSSTRTTSVPRSDPGMPATLRLEVRPPTWRLGCRRSLSGPATGQAGPALPPVHDPVTASRRRNAVGSGAALDERAALVDEVHGRAGAHGRPAARRAVPRRRPGGPRRARRSDRRAARASARSWVASTIVLPAPLSSTISSMSHCCVRGIERGGRLVEQQHLGVHHEHRRDGDALLLAAGQLVRGAVGQVRDLQQGQRVVDPLPRPRPAPGPCSGDRRPAPRGPSARTPGRRSSGR